MTTRSRTPLLLLLPAALAFTGGCRRSPPGQDSHTTDDTHAQDTSDDTGQDSGDDSGDDTSRPPVPTDFRVVSVDASTWVADGYDIVTYELAPDAPAHYDSLFSDSAPTFYLMVPSDLAPGEPLDVLVWFHGGAIGDDSDTSAELPYACQELRIIDNAQRAVTDVFVPTALARQHRWAVVVPRNDWCDMWTGWGPDDAVDPERHYGWYHVARTLDFVLDGGAGFSHAGGLYGWGTSMGGTAALMAGARYTDHGGFDAIVSDSAPSSMFWYYELDHFGTDHEILEHTFGGPPYDDAGDPTEAWDRYAAASGETLISSGALKVPLYAVWNQLDGLSDHEHGESLVAAMDAFYPDTVRHGHHDFNHEAPGEYYHTQSVGSFPPWGYTGQAMFEFMRGMTPLWTELEGGCDGADSPCEVGMDVDATEARAVKEYSASAVRLVGSADGLGTAWCGALPEGVGDGDTVTITVVVSAKALDTLPDEHGVLTIRYDEGGLSIGDTPLSVADFLPESTDDLDAAIAQYQATRLTVTVGDASSGQVCVDSHGAGTLYLDAVITGIR